MLRRKRFDPKIVGLTLAVMFLIVTPAMYVHEIGHVLICQANGFESDMHVDAFGASAICYGSFDDPFFYNIFGGVLAFMVFAFPGLHKSTKGKPWVYIPFVSVGVGHGINALIEAFFYESYINGDPIWSVVMASASYGLFIGLLLKYGRVQR